MRIQIDDWYDIHKGFALELQPGVTCVVGPNGAGKTTLLTQLKNFADVNGITVWKYSNFTDGKYEDDRYLNANVRLFATSAFSSEGEKVAMHFAGRVSEIGRLVSESKANGKPAFVLLDALDSGASIDRVRELYDLFVLINNDIKDGGEVYVVVAINQYELAKSPLRCVDCRTGKTVKFSCYDEYAEYICGYLGI